MHVGEGEGQGGCVACVHRCTRVVANLRPSPGLAKLAPATLNGAQLEGVRRGGGHTSHVVFQSV